MIDTIDLDFILPHEESFRSRLLLRQIDLEAVYNLAEEIKASKQIDPVLLDVWVDNKATNFSVVDGLHRIEAARVLGMSEVPYVWRHHDVTYSSLLNNVWLNLTKIMKAVKDQMLTLGYEYRFRHGLSIELVEGFEKATVRGRYIHNAKLIQLKKNLSFAEFYGVLAHELVHAFDPFCLKDSAGPYWERPSEVRARHVSKNLNFDKILKGLV